jgi:hypothetical protein
MTSVVGCTGMARCCRFGKNLTDDFFPHRKCHNGHAIYRSSLIRIKSSPYLLEREKTEAYYHHSQDNVALLEIGELGQLGKTNIYDSFRSLMPTNKKQRCSIIFKCARFS